MGESGLETPPQREATMTPIEYLDKLFAYALSIGMTYDQYWHEDPKLINSYIEAEEIKQRKLNNQLWLQGLYVYQAVGSLIHLANSFSKEHRAKPYLKEPIPLTQKEREEAEERKYQKFKKQMFDLAKRSAEVK